VADVRPFELTKLRMLNASHSILAYLGYLAGYQFVDEAIANRTLRTLVADLMTKEVIPTLPPGMGNLANYSDALIARFENPALKHRTWQIAMDGSQKLPQRLLGTIRDRLAAGLPANRLALGVAAWMRYVTGVDERNQSIDVKDPLAERLLGVAGSAGRNPDALVKGMLGIREIFGDDLPRNEEFVSTVTVHVSSLFENGALRTAASANVRTGA
jgi:fructuronate reductase